MLFLSADDFFVVQSQSQSFLSHSIYGISLILFYSNGCNHSNRFLPIFKSISNTTYGCQFGMINVSTNRHVIQMSQSTVTPLKFVPLLILYLNGHPYMIYDGPKEVYYIQTFISEISNSMSSKQQNQQNPNRHIQQGTIRNTKHVPEYLIGIGHTLVDDVTYLEFDGDSYIKPQPTKNPN
jgi:hypothetical protein